MQVERWLKQASGRATLHLAGRSALYFAARIAGAAMTYATHVLLARWLGAAEFGRYAEAFAGLIVLATFCVLGLSSASLRVVGGELASGNRARLVGFVRRSRQLVLLASCAVSLLCSLGTWLLVDHFGGVVSWPFMVVFAGLPLVSLLRLHSGVALAFSRTALNVLPNIIARPALFLATLGVLWLLGAELTPARALGLHVAAIALVLLGQSYLLARALHAELGGAQPQYRTREWLRLSSPLLLVGLHTNFYPELNVFLLGFVLAPEDVALFNAAFRTAFLIAFAIAAIDTLTLPRMARLHAAGDMAGLQRLLAQGALIKCVAGIAMLVSLAIWGRLVLSLFGEPFSRAYPVLMVLAVTQLARCAFGPLLELLNVTGHQRTSLGVSAASLAATVALVTSVAPRYGINGAAIAVLAVSIVSSLWMHAYIVRRLGVWPSILAIVVRGGARDAG